MTAGGVATRSGEFRFTMMLERCLEGRDEPDMVEGEKAAMVAGWESSDRPLSGVDDGAMESIHGMSSSMALALRVGNTKGEGTCGDKHTESCHSIKTS